LHAGSDYNHTYFLASFKESQNYSGFQLTQKVTKMRRRNIMKKLFLLALSILVIGPAVYAQNDRRAEIFIGYSNLQAEGIVDADDPSEVFDADFFDRRLGLHGINASVAGFFNPFFGIKGDFSFNRNKDSASIIGGSNSRENRVIYFMAGPTFKFRKSSKVEPFVHALVGGAHTRFVVETVRDVAGTTQRNSFVTSSTDFAAGIGGGLDIRLGERFSLRAIQVDYLPIFLGGRSIDILGVTGAIVPLTLDGQRQDNIRISVGIVF
jgi:opacity protein-like surface antigen